MPAWAMGGHNMRLRQFIAAIVIGASLAVPGRADTNVYYHAGGWDAFDGQDAQGQPFCGLGSRNPADGRTFSLRFAFGGSDVIFIASKNGWSIPDHTQIPVVMQVGLDRPCSEQAIGSGDRVQWTLDRTGYQKFDAEFRGATSMTVTFPSGNEQAWIIMLAGSSAVSTAMGRCISGMAQRAASAASSAPAAAAPAATQPFGATATAPPAPAAASPAASGAPAAPPPAQPSATPPSQPNSTANPSH
jgi:hypothetical protein